MLRVLSRLPARGFAVRKAAAAAVCENYSYCLTSRDSLRSDSSNDLTVGCCGDGG